MKFILSFLTAFILLGSPVLAHEVDHPELDDWYASLRMPDNPTASCCGKADGYFCDHLFTKDDKNYCIITDDRVVAGRRPRPVGTQIEIPDNKMMDGSRTRGNPTGHSVVFLSSGDVPVVYCFIVGTLT